MSYKKKYKSIFGAKGLITAPNHLAELIVQKRADKKGLKIPDRIWDKQFKTSLQHKYWHSAYMGELTHSYALLKKYDEDCIIEAFNSFECKPILTLRNSKLSRVAGQLQEKKDLAESVREKNELNIVSNTALPRKKQGKKTRLGKLK